MTDDGNMERLLQIRVEDSLYNEFRRLGEREGFSSLSRALRVMMIQAIERGSVRADPTKSLHPSPPTNTTLPILHTDSNDFSKRISMLPSDRARQIATSLLQHFPPPLVEIEEILLNAKKWATKKYIELDLVLEIERAKDWNEANPKKAWKKPMMGLNKWFNRAMNEMGILRVNDQTVKCLEWWQKRFADEFGQQYRLARKDIGIIEAEIRARSGRYGGNRREGALDVMILMDQMFSKNGQGKWKFWPDGTRSISRLLGCVNDMLQDGPTKAWLEKGRNIAKKELTAQGYLLEPSSVASRSVQG